MDLQLRESIRDLDAAVWAHIEGERFAEAEIAVRRLIDLTEPDESERLNLWFGLLAGVLNVLGRPEEGTEMYQKALDEARRMPPASRAVDAARYMLGNQYLLFGDPRDALETVQVVPEGVGHVQCLLHAVAAEALWKLERKDASRVSAQRAIDTSPTEERRTQLSDQLRYILKDASGVPS